MVTRPQPDAERTAELLRARGHDVLIAPLLELQPIPHAIGQGPWTAVLVTSANAIRAFGDERTPLRELPLLAVGDRTAETAQKAGFLDVRSAAGDAKDLVGLAVTLYHGCSAPLLYLAGEHRAHDLAGALAGHGIPVATVVVYRMAKCAKFADAAHEELAAGRIDGVTHYSRRTAQAYLDCATRSGLEQAALAPVHYCLSGQVAAALRGGGASRVRVAAQPDEKGMLRLFEAE
jgi:uroporphyrinogen-III synthase